MIKFFNPANIALGMIWIYRKVVSPWMLPCCRFSPTCSEYAQTALKRHGLIYGSSLAAWRILRCNPFCRGGHDPVPGEIHSPCGKDDHQALGIKKVVR